ncbi:hypothetical protein [Actinoallomurus rhizosphaericola]|uniref:hypothetical protein n=1 Tax=Actinoallomurus rhizosphaericola TaxID=2952536 RepID=UPI002091D57C|nr:hypothetical protein [Actinoallomurus rhizosphaericola]MCO5994645.1 hypothetical protein [Actinoallomurus rhizosphaericola]
MIVNLKLAALATGAAGAIVAGGVAYAAVGSSSPAPSAKPVADSAKSVVKQAEAAVPGSAPTCLTLPQTKLPKGKLPKAEVPKAELPKGEVPKAELPKAELPKSKLPADKLPKTGEKPNLPLPADKAKVPAGEAKVPAGKVPSTLPTCAPGKVQSAQSTPKSAVPVAKPGLPKVKVPEAKLPSCDSVPAVVKIEHSKAKDVTLPTGLHLAASHSHSITIQNGEICTVVQKFAAAGGKYLTVERLNVPPQVTVKELAADLKLPEGNLVSAEGTQTWQSPLSTGMLWISDKGYAIYLTGSPAYAAQLPAIATQLRQLH